MDEGTISQLTDSELETLHKALDRLLYWPPVRERISLIDVRQLDRFVHEELARRWRN